MLHAHAYVLLYFSDDLYLHFFVDWWDVFMWTGNLRTLFCLTKCWQIQIIYRFTWKYIICLCCVCLKLAYFMYGWTWEMEHKMYYLLLTWVSVWDSAPYFHSSVSNVNFVLWKGGGVQKYFLYAQMTIQCVEYAITEIYLLLVARNLWDISPYWSLAYWSLEIGR